jgi:hypothetical protein
MNRASLLWNEDPEAFETSNDQDRMIETCVSCVENRIDRTENSLHRCDVVELVTVCQDLSPIVAVLSDFAVSPQYSHPHPSPFVAPCRSPFPPKHASPPVKRKTGAASLGEP